MARYGPEITFLGIPRVELADDDGVAGADVAIVGTPFDGGTSGHSGARRPGEFGWAILAYNADTLAIRRA